MTKRTKRYLTYFILTGITAFTAIPILAVVYRSVKGLIQ